MTTRWIGAALDYIPQWMEFQLRAQEQPGCALTVAHRGRVLFEAAFGYANAGRAIPLTPRHRFRVASHSKTFTASGFLKLREAGRLRLDDPVGEYLPQLHRSIGEVTIAQLLSHSAGITRDGPDCGQWDDRRPFLNREELLSDLAAGTTIAANSRFKYSNHGYGLAGLVLEAITGEAFVSWIEREIVEAAGLVETRADAPMAKGTPMASGHTTKLLLGHRRIIPGVNRTNALAPATGFVSTAADLARFYAQLSPLAKRSILSVASRRELVRRQWTAPSMSVERHYGLGTISGKNGDWEWFGHSGGFQGFITRTVVVPAEEITVSVLTNAADGMAHSWLDGVIQLLQAYRKHGAPSARARGWAGRWWGLWGPLDLVPLGKGVHVADPAATDPLTDAAVVELTGRDSGRITVDGGFGNHGEALRRVRTAKGRATELWLAGMKLLPEQRLARELADRYRKR